MIDLNMDFKDYYKSLNIGVGATDSAIKKAYKQLAKKYHPDSDGGSEEKFKEIQEAYEVLKDKDRRAKYDTLYRSHKNSGQSSFKSGGFGSSSSNSSYQSNYSSQQQNKQQTQDKQKNNSNAYDYYKQESQKARERQETYTNQKDHASNDSNQRSYQQKQYSNAKKNTTSSQGQSKQSSGSKANKDNNFSDFFNMFFGGETKASTKTSRGDDYELSIELDLEDAYHGCTRKLEISSTGQGLRRLEVMIPAGVRDGNKIKIAGEGKVGKNGGDNGDLFLKIKIKEHSIFRLEDDDVHSTLQLEPYEAILGSEKEVITLGSKVEIVIPPQTQNGKILRLRNRGLPNPKTKVQGDHYVHTEIKIKDHYSFEELQHYKAIQRVNEL